MNAEPARTFGPRSFAQLIRECLAIALLAAGLRAVALWFFVSVLAADGLALRHTSIAVAALVGCLAAALVHFAPPRARSAALVLACAATFAAQFTVVLEPLPRFVAEHEWIWLRVACAAVATVVIAVPLARRRARTRTTLAVVALGTLALVGAELNLAAYEVRWLPKFTRHDVVASLLETAAHRRTLAQHGESKVAVATFAPTPAVGSRDGGSRPALVMAPPARVALEVPYEWSDAAAELSIAAGVSAGALEELGTRRSVVFRVRDGDEVLFECALTGAAAGADVAAPGNVWHEGRVPLAGRAGLELVVETSDGSSVSKDFVCGFAELLVLEKKSARRAPSTRSAPSVVFVVADTLRADAVDLTLGGRTPNLARLAARGTTFTRAFSASSWTWPSTASLLTALVPLEHGVNDLVENYLAERFTTLAERLASEGFATAAWSMNPLVAPTKNFDQGFESFVTTRWERLSVVEDDIHAWIAANSRRRFFLFLQPTEPHAPYEPPADLRATIAEPDPPGYGVERLDELRRTFRDRLEPERRARRDVDVAHAHRLYRAEVEDLDRTLGRILDGLAADGLDERTIVVFTSDHGEEFDEHGRLGHASQLFDETTHVPLIIAGPGVPRGERRDEVVENRFVAPTLLELLGVAANGDLAGPSLFDNDTAPAPVWLATEVGVWNTRPGHVLDALRDERWLFVSADDENSAARHTALFDLERDPRALANVAKDHVDVVRERRGDLERRIANARARVTTTFGSDAATRSMLEMFGYIDDSDE